MSTARIPADDEARSGRGYPGAKGGAGVWQRIISEIPAHNTFIEAFAGSAQIARRIKRARDVTIVIDSDPDVCAKLELETPQRCWNVICFDAVKWLSSVIGTDCVVYCDPPYLASVRSEPGRRYYKHEFDSQADHKRLLEVLLTRTCPVLISHYRCPLYDSMLAGWRRVDYQAMTRGGVVVESLYCSFPAPLAIHDTRWVGGSFRERERIKRKVSRWVARLQAMPCHERAAVIDALNAEVSEPPRK